MSEFSTALKIFSGCAKTVFHFISIVIVNFTNNFKNAFASLIVVL